MEIDTKSLIDIVNHSITEQVADQMVKPVSFPKLFGEGMIPALGLVQRELDANQVESLLKPFELAQGATMAVLDYAQKYFKLLSDEMSKPYSPFTLLIRGSFKRKERLLAYDLMASLELYYAYVDNNIKQ